MYPLPLGDIHWYFFTSWERKYSKGDRPQRVTDNGYWKAKGPSIPVTYENKIVGYKMSLDFYEGRHRDGRKTEWKMYEYRILKKNPPPTRNSNAVDPMKVIPILFSYCTMLFSCFMLQVSFIVVLCTN